MWKTTQCPHIRPCVPWLSRKSQIIDICIYTYLYVHRYVHVRNAAMPSFVYVRWSPSPKNNSEILYTLLIVFCPFFVCVVFVLCMCIQYSSVRPRFLPLNMNGKYGISFAYVFLFCFCGLFVWYG